MNRLPAALAALALLPAQADFRFTEKTLQLFVPGATWALTLPREDWRVEGEQRKPDGNAFYYFATSDRGLQLSVYFDRTSQCTSAEGCRKMWLSAPHPSMQGAKVLQEGERNGFAIVTYENANVQVRDRSLAQTNVSAHGYRDGHWIDLRVSAVGPTPPDAAPLLAVLDKVAFAPPVLGGPRLYPAGARTVELDLPGDWRDEAAPGRVPTIRISRPPSREFMVLVSLTVPSNAQAPLPGAPDRSQANVRRGADAALERSVEKSIDVLPLQGESAKGYYYKATDRAPQKGGLRDMAQGELRAGNVVITFTILSNPGQEAQVQRALDMIRALRVR
jgi:hypothetical protein